MPYTLKGYRLITSRKFHEGGNVQFSLDMHHANKIAPLYAELRFSRIPSGGYAYHDLAPIVTFSSGFIQAHLPRWTDPQNLPSLFGLQGFLQEMTQSLKLAYPSWQLDSVLINGVNISQDTLNKANTAEELNKALTI